MFSTRTQIILTDMALAGFMVLVHGTYVAGIAFILGASVVVSLALGLIGGFVIRWMMKASIDGDRETKGARARERHAERMASRRHNPFVQDQQ